MHLFRCDKTFELVLELLGKLRQVTSLESYAQKGSQAYVDAIRRLKEEKERMTSEYRELVSALKSYGFSEDEIEEIYGECIIEMLIVGKGEGTPLDSLKNKLKSKDIKLDEKSISLLFNKILETRIKLSSYEGTLKEIEGIELSGKAKEVESIFNELVSLKILTERHDKLIEMVNRLAKLLCREVSDHSLLPLIESLKLEEASILDALRALDFLVNEGLVNYDDLRSKLVRDSYSPWSSDFTVFMFLLAHVQKILSYEELLEGINYHMWRESWNTFYRGKEEEPLLSLSKILIIPLSLGSRVHARLALALANLVYKDRSYWHDLGLFEELCKSLMRIRRYGDDTLISKLLTYSYFYGDLEAIVVIGGLANAKKSLKEALKELRTTKLMGSRRKSA